MIMYSMAFAIPTAVVSSRMSKLQGRLTRFVVVNPFVQTETGITQLIELICVFDVIAYLILDDAS
jgi:hypothetical protein